jgi:lysophospholipase L1-like esterase
VGDSITANSGWSGDLGKRLGPNYLANNYGVGGTTLLKMGDLPYWNTQAFVQSHASGPGIVVIMLGTNDSKPQNWGAHKAAFVGDYEALIDTYAALPSHPKIFLNLCPPSGNTNAYAISGTVIENEIVPLIRQVAAAKGVGIIDVFSAFGGHDFDPTLYGADQVHPNAAGAQRIADTVSTALEGFLDGGTADAANDGNAVSAPTDATLGDGAGSPPSDATLETGVPSASGPDATGSPDGALSSVQDSGSTAQGDGVGQGGPPVSGSRPPGEGGAGAQAAAAQAGGGGSDCRLSGRGAFPNAAAVTLWLVTAAAVLWRRRRAPPH